MRYPIDGSAPTKLAAGQTIHTAAGDQPLTAFLANAFVSDGNTVASVWLVQGLTDAGTPGVVVQLVGAH